MENDDQKRVRQVGVFVTLPFVLGVPPVIGWWIGSHIDKWGGTSPYFLFICLALGFAAGFRELYRLVKQYGNGV